jgi:surfeit locus 1 family protein
MRGPEARSMFTPADDPAKGLWYTRDVAAMAKAFGLSDVAPFAIDEEQAAGASPQWPRAGGTELSAPNNHLSYALTWFGLAATLLVIFGFWLRRRGAPAAMN